MKNKLHFCVVIEVNMLTKYDYPLSARQGNQDAKMKLI